MSKKNLKDFFGQSQKRIQKGQYAEELVRKELEAKKWQVYAPPGAAYPHVFDFVCLKFDCSTLFVEVKAQVFGSTVCIKEHSYKNYKKITEEFAQDFILFIVNDNKYKAAIYCTQFRGLLKPIRIRGKKYPIFQESNGETYKHNTYWFSLDQFQKVRDLTTQELQKLNQLSGG